MEYFDADSLSARIAPMAPMYLAICLLLTPLVLAHWDPSIIADVDSDVALYSSGPLTRL